MTNTKERYGKSSGKQQKTPKKGEGAGGKREEKQKRELLYEIIQTN